LNGHSSCTAGCYPAGVEEAALGYSIYLAVRQVLCGDPLAVSKSKVADVVCVMSNGMLGINWKVKGTGSAIRKSIGLALKNIDPFRMFPIYSRCIKHLGGSVDKDVFMYVAEAAAKSIKSSLLVGVVGSVKIDKTKLDDMVDILSKKHEVSSAKGTKTKPSGHTACDHSEFVEIKVSGWQSYVLNEYIRNKVRGLVPSMCDKYLLLQIKPTQWDTLAKKLKSGVKDFAASKYSKLKDELPPVFGYQALSNGSLCASDVKSAISNKLSSTAIESAINSKL
jgi:hypothetical protein